jgi:ribonuclease BN (tRNA processing enzyme)
MKIRFLGAHNTETQYTRLPGLLVDDRLALDAGSLTSSLSLEQQLKLSAVLLTHQHLDHLRDIPMIAMNCYLNNSSVRVYGTATVHQALADNILNGQIYSRFLEKPALSFHVIKPLKPFRIGAYEIIAVPVNHSVSAMGFQVKSSGKKLFYTGDTGPGLESCWEHISPDLLVIEVTASNKWTEFGRKSLHLTPELLRDELAVFQKTRHYLPRVITVHMNPALENDIKAEITDIASELKANVTLGYEGLEISL